MCDSDTSGCVSQQKRHLLNRSKTFSKAPTDFPDAISSQRSHQFKWHPVLLCRFIGLQSALNQWSFIHLKYCEIYLGKAKPLRTLNNRVMHIFLIREWNMKLTHFVYYCILGSVLVCCRFRKECIKVFCFGNDVSNMDICLNVA